MERETLLSALIILLSGLALQTCAIWPSLGQSSAAVERESQRWFALWRPLLPAAVIAAWLCGWALSQPDPVPHQVGWVVLIAPLPFALIGARALLRAIWSLWRSPDGYGIATVGLLRPRIVFAPEFISGLDERAIEAAFAHERAHMRHRDPMRIWLAQIVTDLQWPSRTAGYRFENWLAALECTRDDEARADGAEGADLAAAVLGSVRFQLRYGAVAATLTGRPKALPARIARLLGPPAEPAPETGLPVNMIACSILIALLLSVVLGHERGERLLGPLLSLSATAVQAVSGF